MKKVIYNACYGGFELSLKAGEWLKTNPDFKGRLELEGTYYIWKGSRHHPLVVECVETLGETASGPSAKLQIHECQGTHYQITEVDGNETVLEFSEEGWIRLI